MALCRGVSESLSDPRLSPPGLDSTHLERTWERGSRGKRARNVACKCRTDVHTYPFFWGEML